jgi:non-specific serine/threonine protein kinase
MTEAWPLSLPHPVSSFIGREQELAEAQRLLAAYRLLTLTGAGGVGKTRLGHELAASQRAAFPDGIWIVELSALAEPGLVPQAVATVLGVRETADQTLTLTLVDALRAERLLLVLDNCEHLVEACAALADALLSTCPGLRILATSREALGIAGETTFRVSPLSLTVPPELPSPLAPGQADAPLASAEPSPALPEPDPTVPTSEAVRLFVERAQAAMPAFALTDRNVSAVEQICQRLDGLPLAIELAAARIAVLSPEQIAARLDDRFRLLTGGSRTALPRHQTLQAMVDWSHELLDDQERVLLRRLAVFAGGWTLEAAEAVCAGATWDDGSGTSGADSPLDPRPSILDSAEILDLLSGLVAKSLVLTVEHADTVRYRFLESLRAYATEKLRDAGEEATLRERHCAWLLALAEFAGPELSGPRSVRWFDRLEHERENARAAVGWCVEHEQVESGLRLAGALTPFWLVRGPYRESRETLAELLGLPAAHACSVPIQAARARALLAAGRLAMRQDDRADADRHFQEALAICQRRGDQHSLAVAQFSLGHVARVRGDYPTARRHHAEAIEIFEALGDDHWLANTRHDLGLAAYFEGDLATARSHYQATLVLSERLGDELGIASALNDLGEVAFLQGQLDEARALEGACLTTARRLHDKKLIAMTLGAMAGIAVAQGRPTRALRLAGAATALNEATGQRHSPAWHAMLERWLEPAWRTMSAEASALAQAAGRAMSLDEAIEYALDPEPPDEAYSDEAPVAVVSTTASRMSVRPAASRRSDPSVALLSSRPTPARSSVELTSREQEVAALVARGLTNRQIAAELVITEGTAANHVKHILARLTLDSRVQIAAWAIQHGLHGRLPS